MNLSDINKRVNLLTGTSVLDYTYDQRTISFNNWYYRINTWILQAQDETDNDDKNNSDFTQASTDLVANQADYSGPGTAVKYKRVEISYDGINFKKAEPIDIGEIQSDTSATTIAGTFTQDSPRYDVVSGSIIVYPIPTANITGGLKVWYDRLFSTISYTSEASNDLLTGTKTPGFDANFHDLLSMGIAYDWNSFKKNDKSLMGDINIMKADLFSFYGSKEKDRVMSFGNNLPSYE